MVDPSSIASAVAAKIFSDGLSRLTANLLDATGGQLKLLLTKQDSSLRNQLDHTFERCTKIKTLLNRDEPTNLLSLYVNLKFKCEEQIIDDYHLIELIRTKKRIIVTGTGGGGKTIFMKYLWISLFENPRGKIPIFIELRRINEFTSDRLDLYIYHSITDTSLSLSQSAFEREIQAGSFVFILDGFDEIVADKRTTLENQILDWAYRHPELTIIVSGRWDERFAAWQTFSTFHVLPFEMTQVVKLISKLKYDQITKRKFIEKLKQTLFVRHKSFLSNPLLATMMLLTFDQFAEIPEKVHLFYEQAFDTLFFKHDATKEAYKRKMHSNCSIDVFKKLLSYFCLASYYEEKFELTETEAITFINKGLKVEKSDINPSDFLLDLVESVCILRKDGLVYTFTHRSFQEFFAAYCLARIARDPTKDVLTKVIRRPSDQTIKMLFEMDKALVETQFVIPKLKELYQLIGNPTDPNFVERYCFVTISEITIFVFSGNSVNLYTRMTDWGFFVLLLSSLYPLLNLRRGNVLSIQKSDIDIIKPYAVKKRRPRRALIARITIDSSGRTMLSGTNTTGDVTIDTFDAIPNTSEFTEPASWFHKTDFVHRCRQEALTVSKLLDEIERKRGYKNKAIDDLLKLN